LEGVEDILESVIDIVVEGGRAREVERDMDLEFVGREVVHAPRDLSLQSRLVDQATPRISGVAVCGKRHRESEPALGHWRKEPF
jgi:hypothetical protein